MNYLKIAVRWLFCILSALCLVIFGALFYLEGKISDSYKISEGEALKIESAVPISISYTGAVKGEKGESGGSFDAKVKVFGFVPARNITVSVVDNYYVAVLGTPFGIKIYTEGVLVVGFSEVATASGRETPAKSAGIKEGDYIVSLNGTNVYTNEEVLSLIQNSNGEDIVAKIVRNGTRMTIRFKAARSTDGVFRAGMWVKDSSAGIGTLTFYSPSTNIVCGLGHGIADSDTGTLLTLSHGEFVTAKIVSVEKGSRGEAGELKGRFTNKTISGFSVNCENGVYGIADCDIDSGSLMRVAMKQEVKDGAAQILATVDGEKPQYYSCTIKIKSMGATQNLLIHITDKRLLEKTGGIVQGMSGSPIIQNGKLVGAVTHVLIDDPKSGYGIFAETMLETAEDTAYQYKNAS